MKTKYFYELKQTEADYEFMSYSFAHSHDLDLSDYRTEDTGTIIADSIPEALEALYRRYNLPELRPINYGGRSMSVSDIVTLHDENGEGTSWYCDNVGFKQIEEA